jgi:hypothetical protein
MNKMIRRPGSGELHLALFHHGAGGGKLVLVPLDVLAVDEMSDIQDHLAAVGEAAADFLVEGHEEPVHLEADGAGAGLAFAGAGRIFAQIAQVFAANALSGEVALNLFGAAVIDKDLEVHFGLAAKLVNIAQELALIGANGFAESLVVRKDGAEAEGKDGGVLETIGDDACVIDTRLLVKRFLRIMFTDNDGEITGWI